MSSVYEKNLYAKIGDKELNIKILKEEGKFRIFIGEKEFFVDCERISEYNYSFILNGIPFEAEVERENDRFRVYVGNVSKEVFLCDLKKFSLISKVETTEKRGEHLIRAPMPGKIVKIFIKEGEVVKKSQSIFTMEAMKMENEIRSPVDGRLKRLFVKPMDVVESKAELAVVIEE